MGFHEDAIFPTDISYGSRGGPRFYTNVVMTSSGKQHRTPRWSAPLHVYDARYGVKTQTQAAALKEFCIARLGPGYGFKYKDFSDFTSAADGESTPTDTDQILGEGDASEKDFQLIKTYSDGNVDVARTIRKPVSGTVVVALDGVPQSSGWTVSTTTGIVHFDVAPGNNVVVTAGFEYYVAAYFGIELDEGLIAALDEYDIREMPSIPIIEDFDPDGDTGLFHYRGAAHLGVLSATDNPVTLLDGFAISFENNTSTRNIVLPYLDNSVPAGGIHFAFENTGDATANIKNTNGDTIVALAGGGATCLIWVGESSSGTKSWRSLS